MEKCSTHSIKVNLKSHMISFLLPSMLGRKPEFWSSRLGNEEFFLCYLEVYQILSITVEDSFIIYLR